jgi:uncharacterized protein (TIGR03437 family)
MRSFLPITIASLVLSMSAWASSTTCPTGSYTLYLVPGFACQSGNLIFKNFGYSSSASPSGIAIPASAVMVTPITTGGNEGFQFAGPWNVGLFSSSIQDSIVTYTVTSNAGAALTRMHLFFNGSFTGVGSSSVAEFYCLNYALPGCPEASRGQLSVTNPLSNFNDAVLPGGVTSVSVAKEINVKSGVNGTASISQATNTFSNAVASPLPVIAAVVGIFGSLDLSPGMVVTAYGTNLAATSGPSAATKVFVNGVPALVYYVSPGAVDFRIPQQTPVGPASVVISNSPPFQISLADYSPVLAVSPNGAIIALHADGSPITAAHPAAPGENITAIASGLGANDRPTLPKVTVGGVFAVAETVAANAFMIPGLYGLGFVVPAVLRSGYYPLAFSIGGKSTPSSPLRVLPVLATGLFVSQGGATFRAVAGTPAILQRLVSVQSASGVIAWKATVSTLSGGEWLRITPAEGTSDSAKPAPTLQITATPGALTPGDYYGLVTIQPVLGSAPLFITVMLSLTDAAHSPGALVEPAGIVFVGSPGGAAAPRNIQISNPTTARLTFTTALSTGFNYQASGDTVDAGQSLNVAVSAVAGLAKGVYPGSITFRFSDAQTRVVNLLFIVAEGAGGAGGAGGLARTTLGESACIPMTLLPILTELEVNFTGEVGWPSRIASEIRDNCGNPLTDGWVRATFTNGDPVVPLAQSDTLPGRWGAGWTPVHATAGMTVTVEAHSYSPPLQGSVTVSGSVGATHEAPVIGAILGSASYVASPAPGTLITMFGSNLAARPVSAPPPPLPLTLADTSVTLGGRDLPLLYVSDQQINAIVPYGLTPGASYQAIVQRGDKLSVSEVTGVQGTQPGVFTTDSSGKGQGHVYKVTPGSQILAASDPPGAPVGAGDILTIYCAGLGEIDPHLDAGSLTPSSLFKSVQPVTATIGGVDVDVQFVGFFAGLSPGSVGLYQVNLKVPDGVPSGDATPLILTAGDRSSSRSSVTVMIATR